MAKTKKLCKVHPFFTSPNLSQCTTCEHRCSKLLHNAELLSQVNAVTHKIH